MRKVLSYEQIDAPFGLTAVAIVEGKKYVGIIDRERIKGRFAKGCKPVIRVSKERQIDLDTAEVIYEAGFFRQLQVAIRKAFGKL